MLRALIAGFLALSTPVVVKAHSWTEYLGNAGVLVQDGETRILFDAFYSDGYGQYLLVADATRDKMMKGEPPFDGIVALFVSHVHGDHFSPEPTLAYLRARPAVNLYGSGQVTGAILELAGDDAELAKRLHAVDLQPGDAPRILKLGDLLIEAAAVPHAGGERMAHVRNLLFRVTLNGSTTVMHLGDADADDAHFAPLDEFLRARRADVAFPPYWFYLSDAGKAVIEKRLNAERTIGVHVPAEAVGKGDEWREQAGGDLFTDPGERRPLGPTK